MHRTIYVRAGYGGCGKSTPYIDRAFLVAVHAVMSKADIASVDRVFLDEELGLLSIEHDGHVAWDELQLFKNAVFGEDACAIEIYPPDRDVVNNLPMRHLWLLGEGDWWPDLSREGIAEPATLRERYFRESSK